MSVVVRVKPQIFLIKAILNTGARDSERTLLWQILGSLIWTRLCSAAACLFHWSSFGLKCLIM